MGTGTSFVNAALDMLRCAPRCPDTRLVQRVVARLILFNAEYETYWLARSDYGQAALLETIERRAKEARV